MTEQSGTNWEEAISDRPEQLRAITSECALTVVSAGAGTGKTHTLSQRFAWILAKHPDCAVDEILVLTFTEKAAREMQERIAHTVKSWHENNKSELKHLRESVLRMGDAYISTIHAFAMKMIRESALTLDVDPTASIAPEPKEDLWWESYAYALDSLSADALTGLLDDTWKKRADELFASDSFIDFVNTYTPAGLAAAAKNACGTLGSAGHTAEELWNWPEGNLLDDVASMEKSFYKIWELWMDDILPGVAEDLRAQQDKHFPSNLLGVYEKYRNSVPSLETARAFTEDLLQGGLANLKDGKQDTKKRIVESLGESIKSWRDNAQVECRKATPPTEEECALSRFLNRVAALGWQCWDNLRRSENMLSMNDLIAYAGEIAKREPAYARKFKYILVDEFQDTDALQDAMISSLWTRENKLFLVGDLKQSIYRFRHADLTIFQRYIEKARNEPDSCYITLDRSFRTKGELLADFNAIFSNLWSEGLEPGSRMTYEALGGPDDADWWQERNRVALLPVLEPLLSAPSQQNGEAEEVQAAGKENIGALRLRLFRELAERFKAAKEAGEQVWDKNGDKPGHRAVRWSDFAVLVPTRTSYTGVERAFEEAGVPFVLCTSKNYFARGEVGDIVNLILLLGDPENPLYLAGWLASPFSGAPAGFAEGALCGAGGDIKKLNGSVQRELPGVWQEIGRLRRIAALEGPAAAILELLKKPAYLELFDPQSRRSVMMNLSYLAGIAAEYERSEGVSLAGFADYLQMLTISPQQKEEPDVSDETQDAVQVLTIHASKGLEYPVVAVLCDEGGRRGAQSIFVSPRYGVVVKRLPLPDDGSGKDRETTVGAWYQENDDQKAASERERLWYVALTRARDKLFLCGTSTVDKDGELGVVKKESFLKKALDAMQVDVKQTILPPSEKANGRRRAAAEKMGRETLELPVVSPAKLARLSASAYAMLAWCPNAYRIAYRQGRDMQWTVKSGESSSGADFGSLAHWILARWDFDKESLPIWLPEKESERFNEVERQLPALLRAEFRSAKTRGDMHTLLCAFTGTATAAYLRQLNALQGATQAFFRETPFRVQDGDLLLVGSIDLYYKDADGIHVRDWKTTDEAFAPSEYYDAQLDFYSYAVWRYREQMRLPQVPLDKAIIYIRPGEKEMARLRIPDGAIEEAGRRIHAASETALLGDFCRQPDQCGRCPWRKDCF